MKCILIVLLGLVSGYFAEHKVPDKNFAKLLPHEKENLKKLFKFIDEHEDVFIYRLWDAVSIPSISSDSELREAECNNMLKWTNLKLTSLGFKTELKDTGTFEIEGNEVPLPPVILGELEHDYNKITLLFYGHLDVVPAKLSEGWDTEPFNLTLKNGNLYGRGATDDKGQVIAWLNALEAYKSTGMDIPVNIKIVFECMEEVGSHGLHKVLENVKETFLKDVDMITISDSYWLGTTTPCLLFGLRGLVYFFLEVEGGSKDLHSGMHGGAVHEALPDLIWLLNLLVDENENILIPGLMDDVRPLSQPEKSLYDHVNISLTEYQRDATGVHGLTHPESETATLMARWRYPALSIHGIQGAYSETGVKTVIPRKVVGKFSIRIVPDQVPDKVESIVNEFLESKWSLRKTPNKLKVSVVSKSKAWEANFTHPNYVAASKAIQTVYGVKPEFTREGGSIPITEAFVELTEKNILHLPLGQSDDGAHSQNEKISVRNYILGSKLVATYLHELGKLTGTVLKPGAN